MDSSKEQLQESPGGKNKSRSPSKSPEKNGTKKKSSPTKERSSRNRNNENPKTSHDRYADDQQTQIFGDDESKEEGFNLRPRKTKHRKDDNFEIDDVLKDQIEMIVRKQLMNANLADNTQSTMNRT